MPRLDRDASRTDLARLDRHRQPHTYLQMLRFPHPVCRALASLAIVAVLAGFPANAEETSAPALFQRIVLLGASATAGFDVSEPFGGPKTPQYRFANYVEAALIGAHEPVATQATALLFLKVQETMERQVAATVALRPSLVIGLDAMFWFCYGTGLTAEQRLARFNAGLRLLEQIDAPLVLGDIPDATKAVGGILDKAELPDLAAIAQCNERLKSWAADRKNVIVFPLAQMMAAATANEDLVLGGHTWEKGKSAALVRSDRLHPSRHGLAALAIAALESAAAANIPPVPATFLCRDVEAVYAAGLARGGAPSKTQK
jgi:hypothetical protein